MERRYEFVYTDENGAAQVAVLGDDAAGMPIVELDGPSFGVTVSPVSKSRADARSLLGGRSAGLDGSFLVTREFETVEECEVWMNTHWTAFLGKGTFRKVIGGRALEAEGFVHAGKPQNRSGCSAEVVYFYSVEGVFKEG